VPWCRPRTAAEDRGRQPDDFFEHEHQPKAGKTRRTLPAPDGPDNWGGWSNGKGKQRFGVIVADIVFTAVAIISIHLDGTVFAIIFVPSSPKMAPHLETIQLFLEHAAARAKSACKWHTENNRGMKRPRQTRK
jgi:hypothetical protein